MGSTHMMPAQRRRGFSSVAAAIVVAFVLGAAMTFVVSRAASAQQQQGPAGITFSADAGLIFNIIKPDKTGDYEMVMGRLKQALMKSEDPQRKQMAGSWKIFKSVEPGPNGNVLYLTVIDPVVKEADYSVSKILSDAFPEEVQELYQRYSDAYGGGLSRVNLQLVQHLGAAD